MLLVLFALSSLSLTVMLENRIISEHTATEQLQSKQAKSKKAVPLSHAGYAEIKHCGEKEHLVGDQM